MNLRAQKQATRWPLERAEAIFNKNISIVKLLAVGTENNIEVVHKRMKTLSSQVVSKEPKIMGKF